MGGCRVASDYPQCNGVHTVITVELASNPFTVSYWNSLIEDEHFLSLYIAVVWGHLKL